MLFREGLRFANDLPPLIDPALAGLPRLNADQRAILILHDVEEYTLEECAAIVSLPIGTCKSRVFRARAKLREVLGEPLSQWMDDERSPAFS